MRARFTGAPAFRRMIRIPASLWLLTILGAGPVHAEELPDSIRCDGSIIDVGEIDAKILAKCGTPTYQTDVVRYVVIHTQYWIDEFRNRTILDEYAATYDDALSFPSYRSSLIPHGHSHDFLYQRSASATGNPRIVKRKGGQRQGQKGHSIWDCQIVEERMQRWVYNLGPGRFIRILTLHNGRLVGLEHGGYGY